MTIVEGKTVVIEDERLRAELEDRSRRLGEAEQALLAIRSGEVDSLVVEGPTGPRVFLLEGADSAYRALVEAMSEGAATLGEDATVLYCNRRFAAMLGLPIERVMGSSLLSHLPSRSRSALEALIKSAGEGASRAEVDLLAEGGEPLPVLFSISELARDVSRRFCLVATDLRTQRRNDDLVIAERLLHEANTRLAEALRNKDEFMGVLSHELRNPLSPISNSLFILHRVAPGSAAATHAFEVIERQVAQLTRLVDDLLDVTRVARGMVELRPERVDLNEIVRRTVEDHRSLFDKAGVQLITILAIVPPMLDADAARLTQVVGNLLLNASKFTPRSGSATITVTRDDASRQAVVRVSDTGAGLSPATLESLFMPLFQADRTLDRSKGGLGLGLALVKALVELHGGKVSATSAGLGRGAEFVLRLPLANAPARAAHDPVSADKTAHRVLVIDDNVDVANSLRDAMALCGHLVELAYDGPTGLAKAHAFKPDVVLCDIGLPGMSGYDVARAFWSDTTLAHVHLIALSGYAMPEDMEKSKAAGFEQHLAKPTSLEVIDAAMAQVMGRRPGPPFRDGGSPACR